MSVCNDIIYIMDLLICNQSSMVLTKSNCIVGMTEFINFKNIVKELSGCILSSVIPLSLI